ncbi:amidase [Emericellopsis atlantica]|uniref:Amidase n=1 Tax=Emericellopsis atlantica TaxID=2614577 RepID=A0A9P8CL67_9HYPO|nr:amidase [Emericellopsis atlantica]KAG9250767.1 amidase [Emericellopsis atlantica]
MPQSWRKLAAEKRAIRDQKLAKAYKALADDDALEDLIFSARDVQGLVKLLGNHQVSAENVILAHINKAKIAQEQTNCLTEICFDDALEQARELDKFQKEHGRLKGPLHGVPISLKDQFDLQGLDSTLGYVGRSFEPAKSDCVLAEVLQRLGAIIICKTNLPQSILWCETDNNLWGLTTHPSDPDFTPGGSSGGEATLLHFKGSFIGWGTDIGGSIRIPSHMNGLWGLKPSSDRFSYRGVAVSQDGQCQIPSSVGPIARTLPSLTLATKAVIDAESWKLDPRVPPIYWKQDVYEAFSERTLVVGIMGDDGRVKPHPPVDRVFKDLCEKLKAAGHELVPWDPSMNARCIELMDEHYLVDGGEDIRSDVVSSGEPFLPHVEALVNRAKPVSVYDYWQLNKRKIAAQQAYHEMWNNAQSASNRPVDVLLVPTMPHTAMPHRTCRWTGYTKLFNFLDYTALSFPAGTASKALDIKAPDYEPRDELDKWNWDQYDAEKMDGFAVGIQIVGRRLDEEKVLGVAQQIQSLL